MALLNNLKRIVTEDFEEKDQDLVAKIGYIINPAIEQISSAFNKNITFDNLSRETIQITVENSSGNLKIPIQFKTNLNGRIQGLQCIRADNLINTNVYPTSAPFISWSINANIITIKKITGIQDDNKYRLTVEVIS